MKKFYILSLCALVGATSLTAAARFKTCKNSNPAKAVAKSATAPGQLMRPVSSTEYMADGEEWIELGRNTYTYDSRGNVIVQETDSEDGLFRVETQYNEYDKPVLVVSTISEDGETVNDSKRTYVYDPVVHDFFIERLGFSWTNDSWTRNYMCETNDITRNGDGNITEIVKSLPLGNEMVPAYRSVWNYDPASGHANEFAHYTYDPSGAQPGWALHNNTAYRNIVWEETDGQMTANSIQELFQGANKVKSAEVYYNNRLDGHFIVEYSSENPGSYIAKETFADPTVIGIATAYDILDNNGSYRTTRSEFFDPETGDPTDEPTYILVEEVMFDDHGNIKCEAATETFEGITEMIGGAQYENTYDADGNLKEVILNVYDYETQEYFPDMRYTYGDYTDVSAGVDNVSADASAEGFTVYNLQGVLVLSAGDAASLSNLPAGLYIVNGKKQVIR